MPDETKNLPEQAHAAIAEQYGPFESGIEARAPRKIVDSAVLSAVNTKMVSERDFVADGKAVSMTAGGRKAFLRAYETRMDTLVPHPHFGYRISYRRLLAIQSRLLGKTIQGELDDYPAFVPRRGMQATRRWQIPVDLSHRTMYNLSQWFAPRGT